MTADGVNNVVYDAENHVLSASGSFGAGSYSYNGLGRRVTKSSNGTTMTYVFARGASSLRSTPTGHWTKNISTIATTWLRSITQEHCFIMGEICFRDLLSTRFSMDTSGNVIGQQGHFPFGEDWYLTNVTSQWVFTDYERDSESGNDYAKYRYNVNRLGRFLTEDPARPAEFNPQLFNRYDYAASDPIGRSDPLGLRSEPFPPYEPVFPGPCDSEFCTCNVFGCCDPVVGCINPCDPEFEGECGGGGTEPPPEPPQGTTQELVLVKCKCSANATGKYGLKGIWANADDTCIFTDDVIDFDGCSNETTAYSIDGKTKLRIETTCTPHVTIDSDCDQTTAEPPFFVGGGAGLKGLPK